MFSEVVNLKCHNEKNAKKVWGMAQTCNISSWEVKAGGSQVQGHSGIYS
jgi:hypothetical protein